MGKPMTRANGSSSRMGAERRAVLDDSEFFEQGLKSVRADFSASLADNFLIMFAEAGEAQLVQSRERERHTDHEASLLCTQRVGSGAAAKDLANATDTTALFR